MTTRRRADVLLDRLSVALSTVFYTSILPGYLLARFGGDRGGRQAAGLRTGAGLVGSVAGVAWYAVLPAPLASSMPFLLLGVALSIAAAHRAERVLGRQDDPRIVIDEWIGAWISVAGVPGGSWPLLFAGLVLFRVFDVWKGPWARLQNLPGGFGVVMDDVAAGLIARVLVEILWRGAGL